MFSSNDMEVDPNLLLYTFFLALDIQYKLPSS